MSELKILIGAVIMHIWIVWVFGDKHDKTMFKKMWMSTIGWVVRKVTTPMRILRMNPELERDIDNYFRYWGYCPYNSRWKRRSVMVNFGKIIVNEEGDEIVGRQNWCRLPEHVLEDHWPLDWYKTKKWYANKKDMKRLDELAYD